MGCVHSQTHRPHAGTEPGSCSERLRGVGTCSGLALRGCSLCVSNLCRGSDPRCSISIGLIIGKGTGSTQLKDKACAVEKLHLFWYIIEPVGPYHAPRMKAQGE